MRFYVLKVNKDSVVSRCNEVFHMFPYMTKTSIASFMCYKVSHITATPLIQSIEITNFSKLYGTVRLHIQAINFLESSINNKSISEPNARTYKFQ